jgi:hypothetical protein
VNGGERSRPAIMPTEEPLEIRLHGRPFAVMRTLVPIANWPRAFFCRNACSRRPTISGHLNTARPRNVGNLGTREPLELATPRTREPREPPRTLGTRKRCERNALANVAAGGWSASSPTAARLRRTRRAGCVVA